MLDLPENIKIPFLSLKKAQQMLKNSFPEFAFTLDGKLIGDIGEAMVKYFCPQLVKLSEGAQGHDFINLDGTKIQVKATQKDIVGMGRTYAIFEHLIVILLYNEGTFEIIFDGPGDLVSELYSENSLSINVNVLRNYNNHNSRKILPII